MIESDGAVHRVRTVELTDSRGADEVDSEPDDQSLEFIDRNTIELSTTQDGQSMSVRLIRQ